MNISLPEAEEHDFEQDPGLRGHFNQFTQRVAQATGQVAREVEVAMREAVLLDES